MSCNVNLGKAGTRFAVNSQVFVILLWFLIEHFKLSARTKDARDARDAFLESVYPCIFGVLTPPPPTFFSETTVKQNLRGLKNMCTTTVHAFLRKIEQISGILLIS